MEGITNKVAQSGIVTIDLEQFLPKKAVVELDVKQFLFQELLLKEKDFRAALKSFDWNQYSDNNVAIFCSTEAIIPRWAYMLIGSYLDGNASYYGFGRKEEVEEKLAIMKVGAMDREAYRDKKVVIKGCGEIDVPAYVYLEATRKLKPIVQSLMYGEVCSTVPIFKRKRK